MIKILFGVLILSFAAWGVPDLYRAVQPVPTAASVGGADITADELRAAVDLELKRLQASLQGQLPPELLRQFGIVDRALDTLIERRVLAAYATDLGLVVPDDVLEQALRSNPQLVNAQGDIDPNRLNALRRELGLSESQFAAESRRNILSGHLLRAVTAGVQAPREIAKKIHAYRGERRVARTLLIADSSIADVGVPDDAAIAQFYKESADRYQAPEYREIAVVRLSPEDHATQIAIDDAAVKAEYEARKAEFDVPEKRQIVQAVLPDEAAAKELIEAVKRGTPFAEAAKEASGNGPLDVGTFAQVDLKRRLQDVFADAAVSQRLTDALFAAAPGGVTEAVKGPIGWHVFSLGKVEAPRLQQLEDVRDKLRHELAVRQAADDLIEVANQLDDELGAGTALNDAAEKLGLPALKIPAIDSSGKSPEGKSVSGVDDQVLKIAFETEAGDDSPLTETADGGYVIVRVEGIQAAAARPLQAVRSQIVADWQAAERKSAADAKAQVVADRIKAGESIDAIAAEMGVAVQASQPFTRSSGDSAAAIGGPLTEKLFAAKVGDVVGGRSPDDSAAVVAVLTDVKPADVASAKGEIDLLVQSLSRSMSGDIYEELSAGLRQSIGVSKDQDLVDSLYR